METDTEKKQIAKKSIFSLDSDDELDDNSKCEEQPPATVEAAHDNVAAVGSEKNEEKLSSFQKAKIERSRQKALLLRQARLQAHPYKSSHDKEHSVVRIQNSKLIDTGGGFLIDENELLEEQSKEVTVVQDPAPIVIPERPLCLECREPLHDSFLYRSFSHIVCDSCRDEEDKHRLITRTEAKQEYLLKDCDLDLRQPALQFILRKNPHNPRWGDMKLYLELQIEKRAMEVWETQEKLEEEHVLRDEKREKSKVSKFNKQVKALRMAVRSSVYRKETAGHQHVYGSEKFDAEKDIYFRSCTTCDHKQVYEKM